MVCIMFLICVLEISYHGVMIVSIYFTKLRMYCSRFELLGMHRHPEHRVDYMEWAPGLTLSPRFSFTVFLILKSVV